MKKLLPMLLFLLVPVVSFGQGSVVNDIAFKNLITGIAPAAGATVTVCTSTGTGIPCTPLATVYSDIALTVPLTNPLTADSNGYYSFYAAAGTYVVTITGAGTSGRSITYTLPFTLSSNNAFTGNNTFKNINAIQFADQFTASAITAPTLAPAIGNVAGGGTVANNTYACEITFQGTTGETTATPTSSTTVTGGGASSLQCGPLDVPTGAVTYNVYWQTGGAGSYFAGHTAVALNNTDSQTTTPATSGTQPPVSNTATSQLAAAQAALAGGAGTIYIPSTLAASAGSAGNLSPNQSMFDFRSGTISSRVQTPNLSNQKGTIGAVPSTGWNLDYLIPTALGSFQEAVPLQVTAHLQSSGTVSYWGGINSVGGGLTTAGFGFVRDAARSENAWALTASANCNSTNGTCAGMEIDGTVNNTPVDTCSGGCNLILGANGQRNFEGIRFTSLNGTAAYKVGIDIQPNMYTVNGLLVGGSTTAGSIGVVSFNSTPATGGAFLGQASATNPNAFIADNAVAAQPTCYLWRNAGSVLWQMCQDASLNFANYDVSNASLARIQWNTGANGANIYNTPGTGVHAFNNLIRWTEQAAPAAPGAGFDGCYGDSTAHALECSYNNGTFGIVPTLNRVNTASAAMTLDMSAVTVANAFRVPVIAGGTAGANGVEVYDSTNNNHHIRTNAADSLAVAEAAALAANTIPKATDATHSLLAASSCTDNGTVFSCTEGFSPPQAAGIIGTTTNNNANAGSVGEYVQSVLATGSSVTLTSGVTSNVTSISLTAGDWDVTGAVDFTFGATTSYTNLIGSVSTTTGTIGGQDSKFDFETPAAVPTAGADATFPVPVVRFSLSGTTTVFLVAQGTFTVSTLKAYGTIRARRIR